MQAIGYVSAPCEIEPPRAEHLPTQAYSSGHNKTYRVVVSAASCLIPQEMLREPQTLRTERWLSLRTLVGKLPGYFSSLVRLPTEAEQALIGLRKLFIAGLLVQELQPSDRITLLWDLASRLVPTVSLVCVTILVILPNLGGCHKLALGAEASRFTPPTLSQTAGFILAA